MKIAKGMKIGQGQRGFALIVSLLLLVLVSALAVSVMYLAMSQKSISGSDAETSVAYYAGEAGMEKMMADVDNLYQTKQTPSIADLNSITTSSYQPALPGITFSDPNVTNPYNITATNNGLGFPSSYSSQVASGPNAGLYAQIIPLSLSVAAKRTEGTEVRMFRKVEVALIPVFQFGVFSDADLSYFPGPQFTFGGRVHTNGNLWLASGNSLYFYDKISAYGEVIRKQLANTYDTTTGSYNGSVNIPTQANGCGSAPSTSGGSNCRAMAFTDGSVTRGNYCPTNPNSAPNCDSGSAPNGSGYSTWKTISLSTYGGMILSGATGANKLTLPFVASGVSPIEIIRRRQSSDTSVLSSSRLENEAGIRILLDDNPYNLSSGGPTDPDNIPLANVINGGKVDTSSWGTSNTPAYPYFATATNASNLITTTTGAIADPNWRLPYNITGLIGQGSPLTQSNIVDPYTYLTGAQPDSADNSAGGHTWHTSTSSSTSSYLASKAGVGATDWPLLSGWLRVEYTSNASTGSYKGVTREWLSYGWTRQYGAFPDSEVPRINTVENNAIIILQQMMAPKRGAYNDTLNNSTYGTGYLKGYDLLPINMYDPREGELRDTTSGKAAGSCAINGLMNVVELDVGNLKKWLSGTIGSSGSSVDKSTYNGYVVYFSDRRGGSLDGGYDYLDTVNSTNSINISSSPTPSVNVSTGIPDGVLSAEEDVYQGSYPSTLGSSPTTLLVTPPKYIGAAFGLGAITTANPGVSQRIACSTTGQWNVVLAPRHALRLVNGTLGNLPLPGLTVASEQPVYVVGNYNSSNSGFGSGNSAAAVIADTVTLLSRGYTDSGNLGTPFTPDTASTSYYRLAIATGKTLTFKQPSGFGQDYGTDGGVHNFLRYIENWGSATLNYQGSMVSLYYSAYGTGAFKCCTTVYSPPTRKYAFDTNFLTPSLLPPATPTFKDVVDLGFQQDLNP